LLCLHEVQTRVKRIAILRTFRHPSSTAGRHDNSRHHFYQRPSRSGKPGSPIKRDLPRSVICHGPAKTRPTTPDARSVGAYFDHPMGLLQARSGENDHVRESVKSAKFH
jgi:hypothetical protein